MNVFSKESACNQKFSQRTATFCGFLVLFSIEPALAFAPPSQLIQKFQKVAEKEQQMKSQKHGNRRQEPTQQAELCENFSGIWKGQCTSVENPTEPPIEATRTIEQSGCMTFTLSGFSVQIGGLLNMNFIPTPEFASNGSGTVTQHFQWNDSRTVLKSMTSFFFNYRPIPVIPASTMAGIETSSMFLEAVKLIEKSEYTSPYIGVDGPIAAPTYREICTFEKTGDVGG